MRRFAGRHRGAAQSATGPNAVLQRAVRRQLKMRRRLKVVEQFEFCVGDGEGGTFNMPEVVTVVSIAGHGPEGMKSGRAKKRGSGGSRCVYQSAFEVTSIRPTNQQTNHNSRKKKRRRGVQVERKSREAPRKRGNPGGYISETTTQTSWR